MKRINLTKEDEKRAIEDIIIYYRDERDEDIGQLQSQLILDFVIDKIGPYIYNQGIADMQKYLSEKVDDMWGYTI